VNRVDLAIVRAIAEFSLEAGEQHIFADKLRQSRQGERVLNLVGDKLDNRLRFLAADGYLENLQEKSGELIGFEVSSFGFETCAVLLGFTMFEKLLYASIRRIASHGVPMTGDELVASLTISRLRFGPVSSNSIFYFLKVMRSKGWIDFEGYLGRPLRITGITAHGFRAAAPRQ
jgi:hypothetical protein